MKNIHLLALAAGAGALLIFAASQADAQRLGVGGGGIVPLVNGGSLPSIVPLSNGGELNRGGLGRGGFRGGHLGGGHHGGGHHGGGRFHRGFGFGFPGVWVEETEVVHVIEREVVREVPVEAPAPPPAPKKPYVVGKSYDSLPSGCMKLIDDGASFYHCSGEWYREVGEGSSVRYKAVARSGSIFGG